MTLAQLMHIMPLCKRAPEYLPLLNVTCERFEITSYYRLAAFLAQVAHESAELRFWVELASGVAYENRTDLGNNQPGDGPRYRGRGPLQITGRYMYRRAGQALGLDFETFPDQVAEPLTGLLSAGWFWRDEKKLNSLADGGPLAFDAITRRINGGLIGKVQRDMYYARARAIL